MNSLDSIDLNSCVNLGAEFRRQPWLTEDERMAQAIEKACEAAVEEAVRPLFTQDEVDNERDEVRTQVRDEAQYIVDLVSELLNGDIDPEDFADWQRRAAIAVKEWGNV